MQPPAGTLSLIPTAPEYTAYKSRSLVTSEAVLSYLLFLTATSVTSAE